jgi:transcriptional regulator with GAF, ATPase, and Fis domain
MRPSSGIGNPQAGIAKRKKDAAEEGTVNRLSMVAAAVEFRGDSPCMARARACIVDVARAPDTSVLLTGESGTGKGVAARLIHASSARRNEPFVAIDCVALPAPLADSELFGYEKGAFTGAERTKPGKLELAGRGTVLLDEIGDMDLALQGKLLRVLEERTFERVGGVTPIPFEARVIAATHRDLAKLVHEGQFRLDLFHRLSVFPIHLPPLRKRGDDIIALANHFIEYFGQRFGKSLLPLDPPARERLRSHAFPGNVRELRNLIERAVVTCQSRELASGAASRNFSFRRKQAVAQVDPPSALARVEQTRGRIAAMDTNALHLGATTAST